MIKTLLECGREFYERQWMWGMAGNLSVRLSSDPLSFAITPSGINKGHMVEKDLITISDAAGAGSKPLPKGKGQEPIPSSETVVHQAIYQALPGAGAVFHVHPVYSTLISKMYGDPAKVRMMKVEGVMMMKGMIGAKEDIAEIAIIPSWPDPAQIARDVAAYIQSSAKVLPAVLIHNHGLTGWGPTPDQARNHLEIIEYTCQYLYLNRMVTR
jgi:methylthioribulose-1-phosphate dehydratase